MSCLYHEHIHRWDLPYLQYLFIEPMGLLPDTLNCGLRMRRECRERFSRHLIQRKPLVSDPGMHHRTCVAHVPWCMSGSLTRGGGENVPGILGACATRNFTYRARGLSVNIDHWRMIPSHVLCGYDYLSMSYVHCSLAMGSFPWAPRRNMAPKYPKSHVFRNITRITYFGVD